MSQAEGTVGAKAQTPAPALAGVVIAGHARPVGKKEGPERARRSGLRYSACCQRVS